MGIGDKREGGEEPSSLKREKDTGPHCLTILKQRSS